MRAVVVEDQMLLLDAMAKGLPLVGIEVVGQARDEASAIRVIEQTAPDIAVLDIRLPPTFTDEGLRIAAAVRTSQPDVALLVLSSFAEIAYAEQLLTIQEESRAIGYVQKDQAGDLTQLAGTMRRVAAGEVFIDPRIVERLIRRRRRRDPLTALTPTERRILALLAQGRSNTGIADDLGQKLSTIEKYVSTITSKLGLPTRQDPGRREINVRVLAVLAFLRSSGEEAHA